MIIATVGFQQFALGHEDAEQLMLILDRAKAITALPNTGPQDSYYLSGEPTLQLSFLPDSQLMSEKQSQEIIANLAERAERDHQQFTEQQ